MNDLVLFYQLKEEVRRTFQSRYPYFEGTLKSLSSQDILNLIDDIQEKTKQTISEKWIYTHLKPNENSKLPRKDMLDILAVYASEESWEAFKFKYKVDSNNAEVSSGKRFLKSLVWSVGVLVLGVLFWNLWNPKKEKPIEFHNSFSKDTIARKEIKAYQINDNKETEIPIEVLHKKVEKPVKVVLKSPFYKPKSITVQPNSAISRIVLEPEDHAMMLKAFMKSDIKDWQTRKAQLDAILSDDLEVMVMLKNNLGAEYFNKEEFAQKVVIPSQGLKQMTIVELKTDANHKIQFVRIIQD